MAFEIQEISIQMRVSDTPYTAPGDAGRSVPGSGGGPVDVDAIVAKCVSATLQALRKTKER